MTLRNVTVGLDGSADSEAVLRWADDLTGRAGGRLQAVTAWHLPYMAGSADGLAGAPPIAEIEDQITQDLANLIESAPRKSRIEAIVSQGDPAQVLLELSRHDDLLVVGRRGLSGVRALGSTSRHCAIHAYCSVVVVPSDAAPLSETPRVAVAVDGSAPAVEALAWVCTNFPGSEVTAINSEARGDAPAEEVLRNTLAATADEMDAEWPVKTLELEGDPRSTVLKAAAEFDLLAVGDRGHGGVAGLILGSFATYAVGHPPPGLPVAVVR